MENAYIDTIIKRLFKRYGIMFQDVKREKTSDGLYYNVYKHKKIGGLIIHIYEGHISKKFPQGFIAVDYNTTFDEIKNCPIICSVTESIENICWMIDKLLSFDYIFSKNGCSFTYCNKCNQWKITMKGNTVLNVENFDIVKNVGMIEETLSYTCLDCRNKIMKDNFQKLG